MSENPWILKTTEYKLDITKAILDCLLLVYDWSNVIKGSIGVFFDVQKQILRKSINLVQTLAWIEP